MSNDQSKAGKEALEFRCSIFGILREARLNPAAAFAPEEHEGGGGEGDADDDGVGKGGAQLRHVFKVHAIPSANEHGGEGDGGEGGEGFDALVGLKAGFAQEEVEGDEELVGEGSGSLVDAHEVVAQIAEVGKHDRADEFRFAVGEAVKDVALGAHNLTEGVQFAAGFDEAGGEIDASGGEHEFLDLLHLAPELVDHGLVEVDEVVEEEVGEAVGAFGDGAGGAGAVVNEIGDKLELTAVEGDEEVLAEEEVEFGGGELVGAGEIHRVHDNEEVILVVLELGQGLGGNAALDGEGVEGKYHLEYVLGFLLGGSDEIDPDVEALVGTDQAKGLEFEVLGDQAAVAENEGADHAKAEAGEGRAGREGGNCKSSERGGKGWEVGRAKVGTDDPVSWDGGGRVFCYALREAGGRRGRCLPFLPVSYFLAATIIPSSGPKPCGRRICG